ncbi:MAG: diguanylate cyclase [Sulfuricaulis sp.]|uniref:diguanylate cyclase n=1 Tax=Sulfuricaulis sp. TaxID=2003553 RepID=UPI0025DD12D7|nr:diguanylate cyclase [Sulfuricaulis sp.]MCR4347447.1 diguanylate cyclase [Sulfuricaulis sp.]
MNWLGKTLTRKFIILLAGFLALQALQLGIGIFGILHVGEEGTAINEAGRQRMRMYHLLFLTHEALEYHSWPSEGRKIVDGILADYDAESDRLDALAGKSAKYEKFREAVTAVRAHWDGELKPLLLALDPSNPQAALATLARFEAQVPGHVRHLEEVMSLMELDAAEDARELAIFQAVILGLTLLLGAVGFAMARYVVTLPLRQLTEATRSIAAGAYDRRVVISSRDEIGELAGTFNRMAEAIGAKTSRIVALNEIAIYLTSKLSLRELLDEIMNRGMQLTGAQAACIAFFDQKTSRFKEWVTQGLSDHFVKNMSFRPGGLAHEAFTTTTTTTTSVGTYILSNDRPETKHKLSRLTHEEGIQSFTCLPLTSHASRLGVIYFYRKDRDFFLPDEIETLNTFAHLAAGAIENAQLQEQTQDLAVTDKLTDLRNRRFFDQRLAEEIQYAIRDEKPLSLLLLDIDDFKRINDTYGHAAGDKMLQTLGRTLSGQLWQVDVAARYGGEEFTVILPGTDFNAARRVAERLRQSVEGATTRLEGGRTISMTVSIGIACFPRCGDSAESLVEHADQALYTAKREGKNRVCLYREILKSRLEQNPDEIVMLLKQGLENIQPIVTAVSAKAAFLHEHMALVVDTAMRLADVLTLNREDRETLRLAAQLHEIGMITISDEVLNKRGALTTEDWALIRQHPATAAGFLEQVPALCHLAPVVRHHHERYDGGGYPDGLKGEAIPYLARVLTAADTYAAMIGEWIGHKAKPAAVAKAQFTESAGTQLDPRIVLAFVQVLDKEQAQTD